MSKENENKKTKLDILLDEQGSLLERLRIFQKNLYFSLSKKAKFGIDVPIHIYHEIEEQENEISNLKKQLAQNQSAIDSLTAQTDSSTSDLKEVEASDLKEVATHITLEGVTYKVETPYPFLYSETTQGIDNKIYTKAYHGGGFEIRSVIEPDIGLSCSFYVHGQQVAPIVDKENKKLIIPKGYAIIVPKVFVDTRRMTREKDLRKSEPKDHWTVISPAQPKSALITSEWPQGWHNQFITTTRITYEDGYELWMVQTAKEDSPTLWFYAQGWNVAPIIDKKLLSLKFPQRNYNEDKDK